jgi:hypothetical protein
MKNVQLLSTVAATLLFAVGAVSAQDLKKDEHPAPAPAAQQKAPAEKIAPNMHAGQPKAPETTGQAPNMSEPDKARAIDKAGKTPEPKANVKGSAGVDEKAQIKSNDKTKNSEVNSNERSSATAKSSTTEQSKQTTGQGAAAGAAKLSTEQRTKITSIIREHRTPPVHLNVSIAVGTRIPPTVHFYPLPVEVIQIYPEWRGYDYIMVGNEILVIDPGSHEIVAIIEA